MLDNARQYIGVANVLDMADPVRVKYAASPSSQAELDRFVIESKIDPRSELALGLLVQYMMLDVTNSAQPEVQRLVSDIKSAADAVSAAFACPLGMAREDIEKNVPRQIFYQNNVAEIVLLQETLETLLKAAETEQARVSEFRDGKRDVALSGVFSEIQRHGQAAVWGYKQVTALLCYWRVDGWRASPKSHSETCRSAFNRWKAMISKSSP